MAVTCKLRNGNKINIYFNYKNVIVGGTHEVRTGLGVVVVGGSSKSVSKRMWGGPVRSKRTYVSPFFRIKTNNRNNSSNQIEPDNLILLLLVNIIAIEYWEKTVSNQMHPALCHNPSAWFVCFSCLLPVRFLCMSSQGTVHLFPKSRSESWVLLVMDECFEAMEM